MSRSPHSADRGRDRSHALSQNQPPVITKLNQGADRTKGA